MRRFSSNSIEGETQHEDPKQVYLPEVRQPEGVQQHQQEPYRLQRLEECMVGITT